MRVAHTSALAIVTLTALGLAGIAEANSDRYKKRLTRHVQTCINKIGERADLGKARKIVHWVANVERNNLVEISLDVETTVHVAEDDVRIYRSYCVTGVQGSLVDFRMESLEVT